MSRLNGGKHYPHSISSKFILLCRSQIFELCNNFESSVKSERSKAVLITGLKDCEMLTILRCLDKWLTDGGEVFSLARRPRSTPLKHILVHISVRG
jgi:hypothetical protein